MRLAYIISAYQYPAQLARLVQRLHGPNTVFLIHVDRRTPEAVWRAMVDGVRHLDNVRWLARHACHWGDFGHVRATLKGLRLIVRANLPADAIIVLTGQCYPLRPPAAIAETLAAAGAVSFMEYAPLPHGGLAFGGRTRYECWHLRLGGRALLLPPRAWRHQHLHALLTRLYRPLGLVRRFPRGLRPYAGSGYFSLSREAAEYVVRFAEERPDVVRFFKHVHVPDELFFQTVLLNSPLRERVVRRGLHHIDWRTRAGSPAILDLDDWPALQASSALFARKFDQQRAPGILDLIDHHLLGWPVSAAP